MYAIKTEGLTKKYKNLTAVDNLNLTVQQGTVCALLGVNGAGKTTTIKMLTCLTKPYSGNAFLHNNSIISDVAAVKSIIGVSPQETAVAPNLSVKENAVIKELSTNLQTKIKTTIKKTSDLEVKEVNIKVKDIEPIKPMTQE